MRNSFCSCQPVGFACCGETKKLVVNAMKKGRAPTPDELRKARVLDRAELENKVLNVRISKLEKGMNHNASNKN